MEFHDDLCNCFKCIESGPRYSSKSQVYQQHAAFKSHSRCTKVCSDHSPLFRHKSLCEWEKNLAYLKIVDRAAFYLFPICFTLLKVAYWTHLDFIDFGY